ncbi:unnamed protein product [Rhizopus stolonifer]
MSQSPVSVKNNFRIFSPFILFHNDYSSDRQLIELKKIQVSAMLKSNGEFWSSVVVSAQCEKRCQEERKWLETKKSLEENKKLEGIKRMEKRKRPEQVKQPEENEHKRKKRRSNLPKKVTAVLKEWLEKNAGHPYPREEEKRKLVEKTDLSMSQISNWFINARRRLLPTLLFNERKP